jgi:parvulin-like peptidyl-prolyl isomerase
MARIVPVVVLLFVGPVVQGDPPPAPLETKSDIAATVDGEAISLAKVDAIIKNKLFVVPSTAAQLKQMRADVLSNLIDDLVLKQFLAKNAPKVNAAEIDLQLKAFSESLARKGKSLEGFLKETKQSEAELRESWTILQQLDGYVKKIVTDQQLKEFYVANRDHFDGVQVKASYILLRAAKPAAAETAKLKTIRSEIVAGKLDFAAAARKHSQCPSAADGGDLGFFQRKGTVEEAVAKTAFALKPGEVSEVIATEFGVAIVTVGARKPGRPTQFENCVDEVRELYADDCRTELIGKLRREANVTITLP